MFEQVKSIISKFTEAEVTPKSTLMGDLGLTSFDLVAIVEEFEDEFDIEVEDRDVMGFVTINDIIDYLNENAE